MTKAASTVAVAVMAAFFILVAHPESAVLAAEAPTASKTPADEDLDDLDSLEDFSDKEYLDSESAAPQQAWDPFMGLNRGIYHFNDKLYYWVMKPVAEGYRYVVPRRGRTWIKNFFHNLAMPIRLVNSLLQLKIRRAQAEFARFFVNSTHGILGFGNPAAIYPELNPPPEDTGQTLGHWGIGPGPFLMLPFLGPSTVRDGIGLVGDYALYPVSYSRSIFFSVGVSAYVLVNQTSLVIGEYEALQRASIDPYIAIREAYVASRRKMVAE
jgi:phospholipid-binding lipoprotein MlaA